MFKDKNIQQSTSALVSNKCIENRKVLGIDTLQFTDYPVTDSYIQSLKSCGGEVVHVSKWLNAASVYLTSSQLHSVSTLPWVLEVIPSYGYLLPTQSTENHLKRKKRRPKDTLSIPEPSDALKLINYSHLEKNSFTGNNVVIGVTDAGFSNLDRQDYFKKVMEENRVLGTRDFLYPSRASGLFENLTGKDTHGREVTKCIAGRSEKEQFGVAYNAKFYFARTENAKEERRIEEDAWVTAMEWFDSLGVRLVNSSLGYGKGFDIPSESYKNTQMNGYSTIVAKAAQIAVSQKEMIIVNSAGNSGLDKEWKGYISSPADVAGVISVGATDAYSAKMNYSSMGPEYNGYLKPDISAYSKNGTSFSSPVITGVVACILEKHNDWCNDQIKNALYKSGNLYPYKNNYIGYGVPDCEKLVKILKDEEVDDSITLVYAVDSLFKINSVDELSKLTSSKNRMAVYRIENPGYVLSSETVDTHKQSYEFKRLSNESYCVILSGNKKYVIRWPDSYIDTDHNQ